MFLHRVAVSLISSITNVRCRAAGKGNALAALLDKVFGGKFSDLVIVHADEVGGEASEASIEKDQGNASLADLLETIEILLAGCDDKAIEPVRQHVLDFVLFEGRIAFRRGNKQEEILLSKRGGQRLGNLREKGMNQVGNDKPNKGTAASNKAASRQVGAIVQVLDPLQNLRLGLFGDVRPIAQRLRNRDNGHAKIFSDVFEPDDHRESVYNSGGAAFERQYRKESEASRLPHHELFSNEEELCDRTRTL